MLSTFLLLFILPAVSLARSYPEWGFYYDPQNEFCGQYDCYQILELGSFETHGKSGLESIALKEITKAYRALSRQWHPDKNPSDEAKERFVKIAKAYEILSDTNKRAEYDYLRDHSDEYAEKYGSNIIWKFAPKSDVTFVIALIIGLFTYLLHHVQYNHWKHLADHLIESAVEDLSPNDGGSTESIEIRAQALEILKKEKEELSEKLKDDPDEKEPSTKQKKAPLSKSSKKGKKANKMKEEKEELKEELRPIIVELVNKIDDFGGGYKKPTWKDLLVVRITLLPYTLAKTSAWYAKFALRRLRGVPLSEEEKVWKTVNAIGNVAWDAASTEEQEEILKRELWIPENLEEWNEVQAEREFERQLSGREMKMYKRLKKKGVKFEGDLEDRYETLFEEAGDKFD